MNAKQLLLAAALAAGAALASAPAAHAMPISPAPGAQEPHPLVQEVDLPCARGWWLNRWGRCVPKRAWGPPRRWGPPPYWRRPPVRRYYYRHW
ncbi:hypothetical protein [Methylosinus sp. Sm6]|uniref:hypothetical protein n=1 Tax=Methylosinus sp. Sm6 TaxID=2866948 RepID=UPI001C993BFB|nr:hypothetical protein [Methylosinus sp. Sm6]MBY6241133.1 hypothetical protein [Methylosinus sp. Sm6]